MATFRIYPAPEVSQPVLERYQGLNGYSAAEGNYAAYGSVYEHTPTSKDNLFSKYSGGHKSSAAMSALTLLAFLFFLNILQQCLKDQVNSVHQPQLMLMAKTTDEENIPQENKVSEDRIGVSNKAVPVSNEPTTTPTTRFSEDPMPGQFFWSKQLDTPIDYDENKKKYNKILIEHLK